MVLDPFAPISAISVASINLLISSSMSSSVMALPLVGCISWMLAPATVIACWFTRSCPSQISTHPQIGAQHGCPEKLLKSLTRKVYWFLQIDRSSIEFSRGIKDDFVDVMISFTLFQLPGMKLLKPSRGNQSSHVPLEVLHPRMWAPLASRTSVDPDGSWEFEISEPMVFLSMLCLGEAWGGLCSD